MHLTAGLTDGSVAAKQVQLDSLTSYLARNHPKEPWIVAGDFNLTTSAFTIDTALQERAITNQTVATLHSIESDIGDVGLLDAWSVARTEAVDDAGVEESEGLYEGEEGATFDPMKNFLAADTSETSSNRPQRYDRILVRPQDTLRIRRFNLFGLPDDTDGMQLAASDHSGVRAAITVQDDVAQENALEVEAMRHLYVQHQRAPESLSKSTEINRVLAAHNMVATQEEVEQREQAFTLLKQIVLGTTENSDSAISDIPLVMVPVGSYALGVWTSESDIDCLCIGGISSKTFFKLARQRLIKAECQGVRIIRRVEANTGTMLELSVNGIAMDLQYCPAARVVER